MNYQDYLRMDKFPTMWCSGCGCGIILNAIARSFAQQELKREEIVVVTGIGCWGKADDYVTTNAFHGTHGRALAFATGIKLANPDLHVIALCGDGDGITIGGNHFIHAARRNVDITVVMSNNLNYGMTGGQYSGTTPMDSVTTTSRYGHIEPGFDVCKMAEAAGAGFVARMTVANQPQLTTLITRAMQHKGFSLVEALSPCPTHFARNNGFPNAAEYLKQLEAGTIPAARAKNMDPAEYGGKLVVGKLVEYDRLDYGTGYQEIIKRASGGD